LIFALGETEKPLAIGVIGDLLIEPLQHFTLNLFAPTNAFIDRAQGVGTIVDDDFRLGSLKLVGADVWISFATVNGQTYSIEHSDNLAGWTLVPGAPSVLGTGGIVQVVATNAGTFRVQFYRGRQVQ
jgi:hypothetical protein